MKIKITYTIALIIGIFLFQKTSAQKVPTVIIFSKTVKYRHQSIEAGVKSIKELGKKNNFKVLATEDSEVLISQLKNSDAVIFLSTSGDVFNDIQQEKFKGFIKNGGGFIGIHCAAATEKDWSWYGKMLGAVFLDHPIPQLAFVEVTDHKHPATNFMEKGWFKFDEWYNFKKINPNIEILLNLHEDSYFGGKHGKNHPIAWFQEFDNSKMFYTAMGHTEDSFRDKTFLKHILGGILFVLNRTY